MISKLVIHQMPAMAGDAWLPTWLRAVATTAFVVVLIVHLVHIAGHTRRGRAWHSIHVLMALGMIDMFLPTTGMIVSAVVGEVVFAVAALTIGGFVVSELVRRGRVGWLWPIAGVDLAAMVYMFAMPAMRLGWLTGLLVTWFALQALGWATGGLSTVADTGLGEPTTAPASESPQIATAASAARRGPVTRMISLKRTTAATTHLGSAHSLSVRATLIVMNVGMAYMFLAMQFGMTPLNATMPGM